MADVLPKVKMFIFTSFMVFFVNLGIFISKLIGSNSIDIIGIFALVGGAFIPFTSLLGLISTGFPPEVTALFAIVLGAVASIQAYLLFSIIWNYVPLTNV